MLMCMHMVAGMLGVTYIAYEPILLRSDRIERPPENACPTARIPELPPLPGPPPVTGNLYDSRVGIEE
jgi:hypothetical protein